MLDLLVLDGCPQSRRTEMQDLVNAYLALTSTQEPDRCLSSDEALWALWQKAGERYAPDLVETLILAIGPSGA